VTDAVTGDDLDDVYVYVIYMELSTVGFAVTSSNGAYTITGLAPDGPGYYEVCFYGQSALGGSSATGYQTQCTPVNVTAGQTTTVNAALSPGGAVTGTITDAVTGADVSGVEVEISGPDYAEEQDSSTGAYTFTGLAPSSGGYTVCFDGSAGNGGGSTDGYGYVPECYKNIPWDGGNLPDGTTPVTVNADQATTVDAALTPYGAIAGTVTVAGKGVDDVEVIVYNDGSYVSETNPTPSGAYAIDIPPSSTGYTVCFDAAGTGPGSSTLYASQCYRDIQWNPDPFNLTGANTTLPPGTTPVPVTGGQTTTVNAALSLLPPALSISPQSVQAGGLVYLTFSGFPPHASVALHVGSATGTVLGTFTMNASGGLVTSEEVVQSSVKPGVYALYAVGGGDTATTDLTVTSG
jgi:hypothetical protein